MLSILGGQPGSLAEDTCGDMRPFLRGEVLLSSTQRHAINRARVASKRTISGRYITMFWTVRQRGPVKMTFARGVDLRNPFAGLRPFREDEHEVFFGRDEHTEQLLDRLSDSRFVALFGRSRSGKSSIVEAGLFPHLRSKTVEGGKPRWQIAVCRPGEDPIGRLAEKLNAIFPDAAPGDLRADTKALARIVESAQFNRRQKTLIVIDQLEELFRHRREARSASREDESAAFVKLLIEAAQASERIFIIITMRSEFLADCATFYELAEMVNKGTFLLPKLSRDQAEEVILGPIERRGVEIEPALVQLLLNETEEQDDGLPLLQHALRRMWDRWLRRGQPRDAIRIGDFEELEAVTEENRTSQDGAP
jgi:hypothetical protein